MAEDRPLQEYQVPTQQGTFVFKAPVGLSQEGLTAKFQEAFANKETTLLETGNKELTLGQKMVRGAALPATLGALGGAGAAVARVPPVLGVAAGSALGEAVNQYSPTVQEWTGHGGEDPNPLHIALAAAIPLGIAGAGAILRQAPGVSAGLQQGLMRSIGPRGVELLKDYVPKREEVKAAWEAVKASGQTVFVNPAATKATMENVMEELSKSGFKNQASQTLITSLERMMVRAKNGEMIPLDEFRATMSDLGANVGRLAKQGGPSAGRAKTLYGAMWDDLATTVESTPGNLGQTLKAAMTGTKAEMAGDWLGDAITRSSGYINGVKQINVDTLLTNIERGQEQLLKWLPKSDVEAIKSYFIHNYAPRLTNPNPSTPFSELINMVPGTAARMLMSPAGRTIVEAMSSRPAQGMVNAAAQGVQSAVPLPNLRGQPDIRTLVPQDTARP